MKKIALFICFLCVHNAFTQEVCPALFFSEYIEGSDDNRALEIYNPAPIDIDLDDYVIYCYTNGSLIASDSLFPQGIMTSESVFVIANPGADIGIIDEADTLHSITVFNGNDAIALINRVTEDTVDIIGTIGVDPGSGWMVGTGATNNNTLVRMLSVQTGETDWTISATEWHVFPVDTFDSLGVHTATPIPSAESVWSYTTSDLTASFTNESIGLITAYIWDFGDGNTSSAESPSHTYSVNGDYTVCLTVVDACGNADSSCTIVEIDCAPPSPTFTASTSGLNVNFSNETIDELDSYLWGFGDGNTSSEENPNHDYAAAGTYTVCLTVVNSCGVDSTCSVITICELPEIEFSAGITGLNVDFSNETVDELDSYLWDLGDGNTSSEENPTHDYAAAGTYTVCLTAVNSCGVDSTCSVITICELPEIEFSAGITGLNVDFSNETVDELDSYLWDLGDGNTSSEENPTHDYAAAGTYTVCLTAVNSCGVDSTCSVITICELPEIEFSAGITGLNADFSNETVDELDSYLWDLGDGNTSSEENPTHDYAAAGTYTVCLTAVNSCGVDSTCSVITICELPEIEFSTDITGLNVDFSNETVDELDSYLWDLGDGNISTDENPNHDYAAAGTYTVCLTAVNSCGVDSTCSVITICELPEIEFSTDITGLNVDFSNETVDELDSYLWDLGDGNISTDENPNHDYAAAGTYTVCLTAVNSCGVDSTCSVITICELPEIEFSTDITGLNVDFSNETVGELDSYLWDFGDGNTSTDENPSHTYLTDGEYIICLTATTDCGSTFFCDTITIVCSEIEASFTNDITGLTVNFVSTSEGEISTFFWNFGDGNTSTEINPEHIYTDEGTYLACLTVSNLCEEEDSICTTIEIETSGIKKYINEETLLVYPNPTNDNLYIDFGHVMEEIIITLFDINGHQLQTNTYQNVDKINQELLIAPGVYLVKIHTEAMEKTVRLVKK